MQDIVRLLESAEGYIAIGEKYWDKQSSGAIMPSLQDLGLSVRATNALLFNSLTSIEKLCARTERYLLKSPRLGKVIVKEINDAMVKHGLSLAWRT
ncbi:MAG: hypothetical protein HZB12_01745 [Candidatus Yonathbacteria bacterium]|nr:hypothetical protein [Candidatus Yonathbacteria bacterium]